MIDTQTTNGLEMRWYPTTDERGRTFMAPRWVLVDAEHAEVRAAA